MMSEHIRNFYELMTAFGDADTNRDLYSCIFSKINQRFSDFLRKDDIDRYAKPYTIIEEALDDKRRQYKHTIFSLNEDLAPQIQGDNFNSLPLTEIYLNYPNAPTLEPVFERFKH